MSDFQTPTDGFQLAGQVGNRGLDLVPAEPPPGRSRHHYGSGPFARLVMPALPAHPGLYLWSDGDGQILYIGQTRTPLRKRLGPNGYSTISTYNTLARQPGRTNGGQQTNCRVNALANQVLREAKTLTIWIRITDDGRREEAAWMSAFGLPPWNRRLETPSPQ